MRITTLIYVLFFSSLLLIFPTMRPSSQIELLPSIQSAISLNAQGTEIVIKSNVLDPIAVNWTYYNPHSSDQKFEQSSFSKSLTIQMKNGFGRGYYNITFISLKIATITISQVGIPTSSFIIFSAMTVISMIAFLRKRLSTDFDY